jgi:hypothetical protein
MTAVERMASLTELSDEMFSAGRHRRDIPFLNLLAPHTSGPRDVPRCGALSLLLKDAALQGGIQQKPL